VFKWLAARTAAAITVPLALVLLISAAATPSTARRRPVTANSTPNDGQMIKA